MICLDDYEIYFNNDTISLTRGHGSYPNAISSFYVDMTGWLDDDCPNDRGIYSYSFDFYDSRGIYQLVACSGMSSRAMIYMLNEVRKRYNLAPVDSTDFWVIAPVGCMANKAVEIGCLSQCSIQTLRLHGMDALDFKPTRDNNLDVKLQSVCDTIVHSSQLGYDVPLPQSGKFEKSIYRFDIKDRRCRRELHNRYRNADLGY